MAQRVEQQPPKDEEDEIRAQVARYPRLSNSEEQRLLATQGVDREATPAELAKLLQWEEARVNIILEMLRGAEVVHDQELLDYLELLDDADEPDDPEA